MNERFRDAAGDVRGSGGTRVHGDAPGTGPGSTQATRQPAPRDGSERRMVPREKPRSYYGRPVVKEPIWTWEIPWYFFTGGVSGASAGLAFGARLAGNDTLARRAWIVAMLNGTASPVLLTMDLGRPARFLNMLRVFKVTSPMSIGSWLLSATGGLVAIATAHEFFGWFPRAGRMAEAGAAGCGAVLSTYTAALIANSAIPVWSEARAELPFVFAAGSAASAGAAAVAITPSRRAAPARRLALGGAVAELATTTLMERRLGRLGEPYKEGVAGRYSKLSRALTRAGVAVLATANGRRGRTLAGAGLILGGVASLRWAVYKAGFQSAADPAYTVEHQRKHR